MSEIFLNLASNLHFDVLNIFQERRWELGGEGYVPEADEVVINEQTAGSKHLKMAV